MKKFVCIARRVIKTKNDKDMELVGLVKAENFGKMSEDMPLVAVNNTGVALEYGKPFEGRVYPKFGAGELSNLYQVGDVRAKKAEPKDEVL